MDISVKVLSQLPSLSPRSPDQLCSQASVPQAESHLRVSTASLSLLTPPPSRTQRERGEGGREDVDQWSSARGLNGAQHLQMSYFECSEELIMIRPGGVKTETFWAKLTEKCEVFKPGVQKSFIHNISRNRKTELNF